MGLTPGGGFQGKRRGGVLGVIAPLVHLPTIFSVPHFCRVSVVLGSRGFCRVSCRVLLDCCGVVGGMGMVMVMVMGVGVGINLFWGIFGVFGIFGKDS